MIPKVSIIIPVYNDEKNIEKCIKSLLQQELKELEFIFVNDGSTDSSETIINKYRMKDKRIKIINKSNGGVSLARNIGISEATGEYIGFVDSDDMIHPKMYKDLYEQAIYNDIDVIMCSVIVVNSNGVEEYEKLDIRYNVKIKNVLDNAKEFRLVCGSVWKGIYRSSLIKSNNLYFPVGLSLSEDKLFNMNALELCSSFMYLDKYYYKYSYNSEGAVRKYKNNMLETIKKAKEAENKWLDIGENKEKIKLEYNKEFIYIIIQCIENELKNKKLSRREIIKKIQVILNDDFIINELSKISAFSIDNLKMKILYWFIEYKMANLLYWCCKRKL